jgi:hypothetical protein
MRPSLLLLLLLLLLLVPKAVDAIDGWVSISDLDFSKCKPGDPSQSFSIDFDAGTYERERSAPAHHTAHVHAAKCPLAVHCKIPG